MGGVMRLAISNIAWDVAEDDAVAALLQRAAVDAIDIAPGKYFPQPAAATDADIARVREWWRSRGIELTGMQALLFGTTGLNVFGTPESREALLGHLAAVCRVGAGLGAGRLVFGSPRNRDRGELDDATVARIASDFFGRLGDLAAAYGAVVCLEPNPPCYGANFMTNSAETARVVEAIAHPAIRMQFDTGALALNGEKPDEVLRFAGDLIGHVHASEPGLVPLGDGGVDHVVAAAALRERLPWQIVSIEMVATQNEAHTVAIARALEVAARHYRDGATPGAVA
jgi:sugar phosphate isomerase/epimerase